MKRIIITITFVLQFFNQAFAQQSSIIPQPVSHIPAEGYFTFTPTTFIYTDDMPSFFDAIAFRDFTLSYYELALKTGHEKFYNKNYIDVRYDSTLAIPDEGYILTITPDLITVRGKSNGGVFYGLMTLFQMIESPTTRNYRIPCGEITDYPRFGYRGMHLDCARHFFSVDFIKKYIDYLALYKYNTFHWHLTDDQGWRIEIKQYPKLTTIGSHRDGTMTGHYNDQQFDTIGYGGYYTQREIKDIVKYAAKKHVTIIPEIEMPGHCLAALASYPEYSCTPEATFEVGKEWGVFPDIFCPTEATFTFLENILDEVMELFPSEYIHIGGDEVEKTRWKESAFCQQLIREKNLKDESGLQAYFVKRIADYVQSKGKKIIGWDEILDGGAPLNATIMSWRGEEGGIAAARQGFDAVMTPTSHCYFDYYQGDLKYEPLAIGGYVPLEKVYSYEPVPEALSGDEIKHILGAQGNLWTEYITTEKQVEYMVMPRMIALSEVLWSKKEMRNYPDFVNRLLFHFELLDRIGCNYAKSIYQVDYKITQRFGGGVNVQLISYPFNNARLKYNINGQGNAFDDYEQAIPITASTQINYSLTVGSRGNEYTGSVEINVNMATGKHVTLIIPSSKKYSADGAMTLVDGIHATTYPGWSSKEWLGFEGTNFEAIIDLGDTLAIHSIRAGCLDDRLSWIWPAKSIECYISIDGITFSKITGVNYVEILERYSKLQFDEVKTRYVKIVIRNFGTIPAGNPGAGKNAWLFIDEISIE